MQDFEIYKFKDIFENLFLRLQKSKFRRSFSLTKSDLEYINKKGLELIAKHCREFVINRISKIYTSNMDDGKQTPFKGHPVFKAQHAMAICCRKCLEKWHNIQMQRELTDDEIDYCIAMLMLWIQQGIENK